MKETLVFLDNRQQEISRIHFVSVILNNDFFLFWDKAIPRPCVVRIHVRPHSCRRRTRIFSTAHSLPPSFPRSPHGKEKEGKEKRGGWIKPQKQGDRWGKSRLQSTVRGFAERFAFDYFLTTTDDFGQAIRVISTGRKVHW